MQTTSSQSCDINWLVICTDKFSQNIPSVFLKGSRQHCQKSQMGMLGLNELILKNSTHAWQCTWLIWHHMTSHEPYITSQNPSPAWHLCEGTQQSVYSQWTRVSADQGVVWYLWRRHPGADCAATRPGSCPEGTWQHSWSDRCVHILWTGRRDLCLEVESIRSSFICRHYKLTDDPI
jgi:hypothetical protein